MVRGVTSGPYSPTLDYSEPPVQLRPHVDERSVAATSGGSQETAVIPGQLEETEIDGLTLSVQFSAHFDTPVFAGDDPVGEVLAHLRIRTNLSATDAEAAFQANRPQLGQAINRVLKERGHHVRAVSSVAAVTDAKNGPCSCVIL
jgi:hypothetical protein